MKFRLCFLFILCLLASCSAPSNDREGGVIVKSNTIIKYDDFGNFWRIETKDLKLELQSCSTSHFCMKFSDADFNVQLEDKDIKLSETTKLFLTNVEKNEFWLQVNGTQREEEPYGYGVEFISLNLKAPTNCKLIVMDFDSNGEIDELLELSCEE